MKAILLDIDGTLTNDQKEITPETKRILMKAQEQGIRLVIASGRPAKGIEKYGKMLEMDKHHGLFLCFNGAKVIDCQTGEVLVNTTMEQELVTKTLQHLKQFDVHPIIVENEYMVVEDVYNCMITDKGRTFNGFQYEARMNNYLLKEVSDLASYVDFPLNKILVVGQPEYLRENCKAISAPFEGKLSMMFSANFFYEMTSQGIDKGAALKSVLDKLGIEAKDCIAFGDAGNDITMLQFAGVGVAMANAQEEVKAVADYITDDNNHDGIAKALQKYIPSLQ